MKIVRRVSERNRGNLVKPVRVRVVHYAYKEDERSDR